jgi:hypothetical protein
MPFKNYLQGKIVDLKVLHWRFARVICGLKFQSDGVSLDKRNLEGVTAVFNKKGTGRQAIGR